MDHSYLIYTFSIAFHNVTMRKIKSILSRHMPKGRWKLGRQRKKEIHLKTQIF